MNLVRLVCIATLPFLLGSPAARASDALTDIKGQYELVRPEQPTRSGDKVEVVELFWYGCPHCFHFEPELKNWLKRKPDYVDFRRIPAVFRESWIPHAKYFYAAEQMGLSDQLHDALFAALHEHKQRVFTRDELADLAEKSGVDRAKFLENFDSFGVASKARQAAQLTASYGIQGVPSMIVNGKYRTSGNTAGSLEQVIKVMDILVAEEHKTETAVTTDEPGTAK